MATLDELLDAELPPKPVAPPKDIPTPVPAPRAAGTDPATGKPFQGKDFLNLATNGDTGDHSQGMNPLQLLLAGAGSAFDSYGRGLTGQKADDTSELMKNLPARIGSMLPAGIASVLGGPTVLGQAALQGGLAAMEPGGITERAPRAILGGVLGGLGQAAASGLVKGSNAALGDFTRAGQVQSAARGAGLDLSAGDMLDSDALRLAEKLSLGSPSKGQGAQVGNLMTAKQGDPISKAVTDAYEAANGKVADAASQLDDMIAANPTMPKVAPVETVATLKEIASRNPQTINNIDDSVLRDKIQALVNGKAVPNLSFSEMDELRRAVGPVMAKIERQSESGASNVTTATANRWKKLYGSVIMDLDSWGNKSNLTQDALDLHNTMKDTFKNEVLPLRDHPIAGKILEDKYQRPEDIVRDLTAPKNKSIVDDLYQRLDQGGQNAFDAFRMAKRGSKEFVTGDQPASGWMKPLTLSAGTGLAATAPTWLPTLGGVIPSAPAIVGGTALEQALVHGLNTPLGKKILGGSPAISANPTLNSALYAIPRQGVEFGALEALRNHKAGNNQ